eukprot:TRINITY_DN21108_c1_g1_i7.p1 TRINITY_DN21108_c1_g1~~TRINITY_DN21108_c1_g1_i7.p1  ORF type:complete len:216 (+),score=10.87 TRINITY_DN21108_c1_g1_i7:139-786(+)
MDLVASALFSDSSFNKCQMWHNRLGHPNSRTLLSLFKSGLLVDNKIAFQDVSFNCSSCKTGKSKTLPFPLHTSLALKCFDLVHSNVWGIATVTSHSHFKYFVTFIDDYSRFTWIYFSHSKFEVFTTFKVSLAYVENQFSTSIITHHIDSGGEYISNDFRNFLQHKGIISQKTSPYTPQQNGVSKRKNRHPLDIVHSLLFRVIGSCKILARSSLHS